MNDFAQFVTPPIVQLVGEFEHPDFRDAVALLRREARLAISSAVGPELIVAIQSRPGAVPASKLAELQRLFPLAGAVALLGSWCEGETRTGRPWPGVARLYWYEFSAWWRRQIALRAAGRCPDWAWPGDFGLRHPAGTRDGGLRTRRIPNRQSAISDHAKGVILIRTPYRETADALADVLWQFRYACIWQRPGRPAATVRGVAAGIWDGGQLNGQEAMDLEAFCRELRQHGAPVVALLDFPRRERVDRARELGAAAVLGKPWRNMDLISTIEFAAKRCATDLLVDAA